MQIVDARMTTFRLLYFRDSLLQGAEEIRARDVVAAVEKIAAQPADVRIEVWSATGRVAVIGPALGR